LYAQKQTINHFLSYKKRNNFYFISITGTLYYNDGSIYEGNWKNNQKNGYGEAILDIC